MSSIDNSQKPESHAAMSIAQTRSSVLHQAIESLRLLKLASARTYSQLNLKHADRTSLSLAELFHLRRISGASAALVVNIDRLLVSLNELDALSKEMDVNGLELFIPHSS